MHIDTCKPPASVIMSPGPVLPRRPSKPRELNSYHLLLVYCADIVLLRQPPHIGSNAGTGAAGS